MSERAIVLLGLGYTTTRLARRLLAQGREVYAAVRQPGRFADLAAAGLRISVVQASDFPKGAAVAHTIPPVDEPDHSLLREFLRAIEPSRVVYISATSVYGNAGEVDAASLAAAANEAGERRLEDEAWLQAGPWSSLILRAAAIYGPGRGAHRRLVEPKREHTPQRRGPSGLVSRIHVDDLARLVEAGLDSKVTGAYPVGDLEPCSTADILRWSAGYLGMDPESVDLGGLVSMGRRVDGRAITEALGVQLEYPDYRSGIPACLREEGIRP
jgi:nucleoside-diphosphate-sugar epimerase